MKTTSMLKKIGGIILILGILMLLGGVILLALMASSVGFYLVMISVILNILGITLLTLKVDN